MQALFLTILNMSITATYVMVPVLVLRLVLKRAPKWISYSLWSLVLFRLVFPISLSSALSIFGRLGKISTSDSRIEHIPADIGLTSANTINNAFPAATPAVGENPVQILIFIGACLWLTGVTVILIYSFVSYLRLKLYMREATLFSGNVLESDKITSPFVCGILKPKIYLPVGLSEDERNYVMRHERTHIARRDHLIKPLAFLVLSVHWFNPFMWLAFLLMSRDLEMSCDEKVVSGLDPDARAGYSTTLLHLAMKRPILAGSPLAFGESGTKGRVKNVLNYRKPAFWVLIIAVAVVSLAAVCLLTNPIKTLALPEEGSVLFMEMEQFNGESLGHVIVREKSDINAALSAFAGARKTLQPSIHDYPTQAGYLVVRLILEGERRTLCLYTEGGVYYIEEPYIGVYSSSGDASAVIHEIYTRNIANKGITGVSDTGGNILHLFNEIPWR